MLFALQKKGGRETLYETKKGRDILNGFGDNFKNVLFCLDQQNWIPIGLGFS